MLACSTPYAHDEQRDELHDLLVQLNAGTFGGDEDQAEEAATLLAENYDAHAGYDTERHVFYVVTQDRSILATDDRTEVYRDVMHCTIYSTDETADALEHYARIA